MSYSSRKVARRRAALLIAPLSALAGTAGAADGFFIPDVVVRAENHSNRDVAAPGSLLDQSVTGYIATLSAVLGTRSQRGSLEVRPTVDFQEYPDRSDLQSSNRYLEAKADYGTERGHFDLSARYSYEDEYKFELPDAGYNDFDPSTPDAISSGRSTTVSETVQRIYAEPNYYYRFSQRVAAGARVSYEKVDYNLNSIGDRIDYDSKQLTTYLLWDVGLRSSLETGVYVSQYEAAGNINTTDTVGVTASLHRQWTPTFSGGFSVNIERTDIETPTFKEDGASSVGFGFDLERRQEVSRIRLDGGSSYRPTGTGTRSRVDQFRVQYTRNLTQRWHAVGALRVLRTKGESSNGNDRSYGRVSADLQRDLSRTWYLSAGYEYLQQKYRLENSARKDNIFRVSIGYRGLDPR